MADMRIAIAGIHGEQSTFSMHLVGVGFFHVTRGDEMMPQYEMDARLGDIVDGVEWVPIVRMMGAASGSILPEAYDPLLEETLAGFRAAGPVDGVTDLVVDRLAFEKVERPIFPLDTDFEADLTPIVLAAGER